MRGNYYLNITLHFLYFHITITMRTGIMYRQDCMMYPLIYIRCCENEFNSIKLIYIFLV